MYTEADIHLFYVLAHCSRSGLVHSHLLQNKHIMKLAQTTGVRGSLPRIGLSQKQHRKTKKTCVQRNYRTEVAALLLNNTWKHLPPEKSETQSVMPQHLTFLTVDRSSVKKNALLVILLTFIEQ